MKAAGTEIITDIDKKPFQDAVKAGLGQVRRKVRRHGQAHRSGQLALGSRSSEWPDDVRSGHRLTAGAI